MNNDPSLHRNMAGLLRYALPSMAMMVFMSVYVVVDGLFVSNFVGGIPFAALNFVYPIPMILGSAGLMLGSGGSAVVAKLFGQGDSVGARRCFSMVVYCAIGLGFTLSALGLVVLEPVLVAMGAEGELLEYSMLYGRILVGGCAFTVMQNLFQALFSTAGKPNIGFRVTVAAGVTNIALDAIFIVALGWGLAGAGIATVVGMAVGGLVPLVYFARANSSFYRLGKASLRWRLLGFICANGLSEMVEHIALSVASVVYNWQLLRMVGANGVAAYGILMYVGMLLSALFVGYAMACAPLMSFQYGAGNKAEMRSQLRSNLLFCSLFGIGLFLLAFASGSMIAQAFAGGDSALNELTVEALGVYSISFVFVGFNIYCSSFFTALGNGLVSAVISMLRGVVLQISFVLVLPVFLGPAGIWASSPLAELVAASATIGCLIAFLPKYGLVERGAVLGKSGTSKHDTLHKDVL